MHVVDSPAWCDWRLPFDRGVEFPGRHNDPISKGCDMNKFNFLLLKTVRWSGWPLLLLIPVFLVTGYAMTGQYGFGRLLDEKTALTIHRMLHLPLMFFLLVHSAPAVYLALQRWGWIKHHE
jgi:cytochrome b subunit of formate dehydrogenase